MEPFQMPVHPKQYLREVLFITVMSRWLSSSVGQRMAIEGWPLPSLTPVPQPCKARLTSALLRGHRLLGETQQLGQFLLKPLSPLATTELGDSSAPFPSLLLPLGGQGTALAQMQTFMFREAKLIFAHTVPESLTCSRLLSI